MGKFHRFVLQTPSSQTRWQQKMAGSMAALLLLLTVSPVSARAANRTAPTSSARLVSLDGTNWLVAVDPENVGRDRQWYNQPAPDARPTRVPWIIQDIFPDYHGVAWYWRHFEAPLNPPGKGRYLLRFWAVDYQAEVWVNGVSVGAHEGGETPFTLDVTSAIGKGAQNVVAVRVLNPRDEPIDGITLKQTPHRNKTCAFAYGSDYNHGGIEDSVELLVAPAVRVADLFVRADPKTGMLSIQSHVRNSLSKSTKGQVELTVSPAAGGETLARKRIELPFRVGDTLIQEQLRVERPRLWELNDPFLYRVTTRVWSDHAAIVDEQSARCGFRELRLEDGYFRLNGRRLFLRGSVSGNMSPIGIHVPEDPDWLRRDLLNVKVMGFNAIRFYGLPTRSQLDLCDELGLMVYEEPFSSQLYEDSPQMAERFDRSTAEMILRDRNHPSVVIWGLLNETVDSPQFRHAVETLPLVRSLDDSRVVLLSSGRFDGHLGIGSISNPGSRAWEYLLGGECEGAPTKPKAALIYPSCEGAGDAHLYPQVPHQADALELLRTFGHRNPKPVLLSEYGIGSAVDLVRLARNYEQRGKGACGEARFYGKALALFMKDWEQWQMAACFGRPEDYFQQCLAQMAGQRLLGLNALRANTNLVGYILTGTTDQGYSGEGLTTPFRELKSGTVDALFDGLAPLRWCLFVEPVNLYRGAKVKFEAVLANEDALRPGDYPVRLEVFGPNATRVLERRLTITITETRNRPEPPLAAPVFCEEVVADWATGKYRLAATLERGGAPAGGRADFYVTDPAEMPKVEAQAVLWGEDADLAKWLGEHGIPVRQFAPGPQTSREMILVSGRAVDPGGPGVFKELAGRVARGSTVIFLVPRVFAYAGEPVSLTCLGLKGTLEHLPSNIYHTDQWAKDHPLFEGLPAGGLMDYTFYRELISNLGWCRQDVPGEAVSGAINAAPDYSSGLLLSVEKFGAGQCILNTLLIRENLGKNPAAERLLRNLLRYAARGLEKPLAVSSPGLQAPRQ
jgi:hypothetical protein